MSKPDKNQLEAADPSASVWVEASAGSGKTSVLSDRVMRLLLNGVPPEKILCLTFTTNAAAEMANRITDRLSKFTQYDDVVLSASLSDLTGGDVNGDLIVKARRLFAELLESKGGIKAMTIHAFAQSVLKRFPVEAGISPHFDVAADDAQVADLIREAANDVLNDTVFSPQMEQMVRLCSDDKFKKLMKEMADEPALCARAAEKYPTPQALRAAYEQLLDLPAGATEESLTAEMCHVENENDLRRAARELIEKGSPKKDRGIGEAIIAFLNETEKNRPDLLPDYLPAFLTKEDKTCCFTTTATKEQAPILVPEAERLFTLRQKLASLSVMEASMALCVLGGAVAKRYAALKQSQGLLDYDDMIEKTAALMKNGPAWVMYKLDGGIDHILLDESQDTSPAQWGIVKTLADEFFSGDSAVSKKRTLFVVGDKKQSIYSFQGADPAVFEKMHAYFEKKVAGAGGVWKTVPLYKSFRSTRAILDVVNDVLRTPQGALGVLKKKDGNENAYEDCTHVAFREGQAGRTEIWGLELPKTTDTEKTIQKSVERVIIDNPRTRLVRKIADRIARMLDEKETLPSANRPIRPGDILILLKKRNPFMTPLIRELKSRGVPVAGVDRMKLTDHLAVKDMMTLSEFLLFPDDDLSLATVLRSPLCGLDEETLFALCVSRGNTSLWAQMKQTAQTDPAVKEAHDFLDELLAMTDRSSPYDLFAHVLQTRGKMKAFGERLGVQAYDALEEFLTFALNDETREVPDLQLFLNRLKTQELVIKREAGKDDAVRLMTVHGAKGLQAPIVFLPDTRQVRKNTPTCFWSKTKNGVFLPLYKPSGIKKIPLCLHEENLAAADEEKESNRLLYVALTRAADRLYVCGAEKKKKGGALPFNWYDTVRNALADKFPPDENGTITVECEQTVLPPAPAADAEKDETVLLPDWAMNAPKEEKAPVKPLSPSKMKQEDELTYPSPLEPSRMKAVIRGTLIHKLLELGGRTPLNAFDAAARPFVKTFDPDLPDDAVDDIVSAARGVLTHPDCAFLFKKGSLAETSVAGLIGDAAFSGKIDRLAVTDDAVFIADYKTGHAPNDENGVPEAYVLQMKAYRDLIRRIYPDKKTVCLLIWTETGTVMPLTRLSDE